jgi:hypothetical protein
MVEEQPATDQVTDLSTNQEVATLPPAKKDPTLRLLFYLALFGVVIESSLDHIINFIRGAGGI